MLRARLRASARARMRVVVALACAVPSWLCIEATALGATFSGPVDLGTSRAAIASSTGTWDDQQETIRNDATYSAAAIQTATARLINPYSTVEFCGQSVAAGDVNADGRLDLLVGCRGSDEGATDSGSVLVYLRNASNHGYAAAIRLDNPTPAASATCGYSVAVGDVNEDGRGDVLMGCAGASKAVVFTRNAGNTGFDAGVNLAATAGQSCGADLKSGDFNADGNADLALGCPNRGSNGGIAIFTRNAANTGFDAVVALNSTGLPQCGWGIAVGNFNNDAWDDVAAGCPDDNAGGSDKGGGKVWLKTSVSAWGAASTLTNSGTMIQCGTTATVGDVNGDNRDDPILGCADDGAGGDDPIGALVFTRNAANTAFDAGVSLQVPLGACSNMGASLGLATADFNADGRDDIALGCPHSSSNEVRILRRNAANTGFDAATVHPVQSSSTYLHCASSIATGDFDGNGVPEFFVGCPGYYSYGPQAGDAYLYDPTAPGGGNKYGADFPGVNDQCGASVATGDVNGDGNADRVSGCPLNDDGAADAGSVVVNIGSGGNGGFEPGVELDNPSAAVGDECGRAVAVGDVNADGRDDVVVGCASNDAGAANAGSVVVFTRNVANTGYNAGIELLDPAPAANDQCGFSVAVGDVNGDERGDVVMGCSGNDDGASNAGSAVVFARNAANSGFLAGVELDNAFPAANDSCGISVSVGDVNIDGREDVVMGCSGNDDGGTDAGSANVFIRNATNTGFDAGVELDNNFPGGSEQCGERIVTGDVNGDGAADVVLGCPRNDNGATDSGGAVVFTRNAGNTGFDTGVEIINNFAAANDQCGSGIGAGDVNGDGRADVLLGCPSNDDGASNSGSALIAVRNSANTGFTAPVEFDNAPAPAADDQCGWSVAAGDFDANGRSDVLLGCPFGDSGGADAGISVIGTSASTGSFNSGATWDGGLEINNSAPAANDECGSAVGSGDVNGDGRGDLILGCPMNDVGGTNVGSMIVYTRNVANSDFDAGVEIPNNLAAASDMCGIAVASGDVNADGRDDLVMGCPQNDTGASNAGSMMVYTRNVANTGFDTGVELANPNPQANDYCGGDINNESTSVAVGDVNGDGRDDLLMGCYGNDSSGSDSGSVVVFTRNVANTGFDAGVELLNAFPNASDECGESVAAGDLNGDGRSDVLLGCEGNDDGASNAGSVIVYMRNAGNTGFDAGVQLVNPAAAVGYCGFSSASGDVNGDGRDDVIMGCVYDTSQQGALAVFTRNAANTGFDPGVMLRNPFPVNNDWCGWSVAVGDVNGDGRDDPLMGCARNDDGGSDSGSAVVFTRNAANTGYDAGVELDNISPAASDFCGASLAAGDVNGDGREELIVGCNGSDTGATNSGSMISFSYGSSGQSTTTRKLNRFNGTVTNAIISWKAGGRAYPLGVQASTDGGTRWERVHNGVAHRFRTTGADVRLRFVAGGPGTSSTAFVHDLVASYTYTPINSTPTPPLLVSPAAASSTADTTPDLAATFLDPDPGDTGRVRFEVCTVATVAAQACTAAGGVVVASGSSATGLADTDVGTWTVTPALTADTTYHWHARNEDVAAAQSAWTATRALTIDATTSISLNTTLHALGTLAPGASAYATSIVTASTNDPDGYALVATDESDTWAMDCACGDQLPDWTGSDTIPTVWGAGTSGYMGITVRDTTGTSNNRLAKWGTANASGWPENDLTNNRYAGVDSTTNTVLHSTASATAGSDTATVTWRVAPSSNETAGAYDATVGVVILANP